MTPPEARRILAEMEATWPRSERNAWTDAQVLVWLKTLAGIALSDALSALDSCRESCRWLPSHAEFRDFAGAAMRARLDFEQAQQRALTEASIVPAPADVAQRHLAEIRRSLARSKGPLARELARELDRSAGGA